MFTSQPPPTTLKSREFILWEKLSSNCKHIIRFSFLWDLRKPLTSEVMIIASDSAWYLLFFCCWTLLILRRVLHCSCPTPVCAWMSFMVENDYFPLLHKVHLKYRAITYCVVCEPFIFSTVLCKIPISSFPWEPSIHKLLWWIGFLCSECFLFLGQTPSCSLFFLHSCDQKTLYSPFHLVKVWHWE